MIAFAHLLLIPGMFILLMPFFEVFFSGYARAGSLNALPVSLRWATVLLGILQLSYFLSEFARTFASSTELFLFSMASAPPTVTLTYLGARSFLRSGAGLLALSSFTPLLAWKLGRGRGVLVSSICLELLFLLTLTCLAIVLFVLLMERASRWGLSARTFALSLNVPVVLLTFVALTYLLPGRGGHLPFGLSPDGFLGSAISWFSNSFTLLGKSAWGGFRAVIQALLELTVSLGAVAFVAVPRWHLVTAGLAAFGEKTGMKSGGQSRFSENITLSVLEKDLKQIRRDQAAKGALLSLGAIVLVTAWMRHTAGAATSHATSPKGMIAALGFQFLPLILSARAMVTELPFLDLYRLSLPDPGLLIRAKLRSHVAIQLVLALLLGAISLLAGGTNHAVRDMLFLAATIVVFAPLMTCLAIALGIFFPDRTGVRSFLALQMKGSVAYGLTFLLTYGFTLQSYEYLVNSQPRQAVLAFSAGAMLAMAGPMALVFAGNRLVDSTA